MAYSRLIVPDRNGVQRQVTLNVNNRIVLYDQALTPYEIVNTPDAAPPTGKFPAYQQAGPTLVPINYFTLLAPIAPIPVGVPAITITQPVAPLTVDVGDDVVLSALGTINGSPVPSMVNWSSSLDGVLGSGGTITVNKLQVGVHVITASLDNGQGVVVTDTETVTVLNQPSPPVVTIVQPSESSVTVAFGAPVTFAATAIDVADGNISDQIVWTSNLLAQTLYKGQTFTTSSLPVGTHTITARALDSGSAEGVDTVQVVVFSEYSGDTRKPLPDGVSIGGFEYGVRIGQ